MQNQIMNFPTSRQNGLFSPVSPVQKHSRGLAANCRNGCAGESTI